MLYVIPISGRVFEGMVEMVQGARRPRQQRSVMRQRNQPIIDPNPPSRIPRVQSFSRSLVVKLKEDTEQQ